MDPDTWHLIDRGMQWLIIPIVTVYWALSRRVGEHDRAILKIETMLEERAARRQEDKSEVAEILAQLRKAIERLNDKIDALRGPPGEY